MLSENKIPNRLANEKSPYLLQHAYNPVNWYPWGKEAFDQAAKEDKPIFLSIGYSTCHWCHVMAHESFEDEGIAKLLNDNYVAIKVDKEERPDIDSVYMQVCQALTGQGGWPLTIIMDHKQQPFFAGTYYPKDSRYGMPGLTHILTVIDEKWKNQREQLEDSGREITDYLKQSDTSVSQDISFETLIDSAKAIFLKSFDKDYGGFGTAPKFPTPHNLMFLLRYAHFTGDEGAFYMVESTLDHMYRGGIYDHIGGGFSRYSTDAQWLVPHFEKMLYDNALLVMIYSEMYQKTGKEFYKRVVNEVLFYIEKEMTDDSGGFYCAQDADSEGVEGKYYVFTPKEVIEILGEEKGKSFNEFYDIRFGGNFEGKSIPNLIHQKDITDHYETIDEFLSAKRTLYLYRKNRTNLHKDDKIITSWTSLMIAAYAKAYESIGDERYLEAAINGISFIEDKMSQDNRLKLSYRECHAYGEGHIDDYAFFVWALLEVYQSTFEVKYLKKAMDYQQKTMELFYDEDEGGYYLYSSQTEQLIIRPKEAYDGAIPSGNAVAAYNMLRLSKLTGDPRLEKVSQQQLDFMKREIGKYPSGHSFGLISFMMEVYGSKELVCVLKDDQELDNIRKELNKVYSPGLTIIIKKPGEEELEQIAPFTKDYQPVDGRTAFYLCEHHTCRYPVTDLQEVLKDL